MDRSLAGSLSMHIPPIQGLAPPAGSSSRGHAPGHDIPPFQGNQMGRLGRKCGAKHTAHSLAFKSIRFILFFEAKALSSQIERTHCPAGSPLRPIFSPAAIFPAGQKIVCSVPLCLWLICSLKATPLVLQDRMTLKSTFPECVEVATRSSAELGKR
jgi:hypothetical protein